MKLSSIFLISSCCVVGNALGSTPDAQFCDSILSLGYENYSNQTENLLFENFQNAVCYSKESFKYATQNSTIGGSIDLFEVIGLEVESGEGNESNVDLYEKFCGSSNFNTINKFRFRTNSQKISSRMTKSWESCKANHLNSWQKKYGTIIGVTPQPNFKEFTVNFDARTAQGNIQINSISPDSVSCYDGKKLIDKFPHSTNEKNSFTLNCEKRAGHDINFSSSTNAGPSNTVKVAGEAPVYLDLQKDIARLEATIREQAKAIANVNSKRVILEDCAYPTTGMSDIDSLGNSRDYVWNKHDGPEWKEVNCPSGQVMVGRESAHYNGTEDRVSSFKCCSVSWK